MVKDLVKQDDFDIGVDISDMMMIIMMVVMVSVLSSVTATTAQAAQTTQALQAQSYEGLTYSTVLTAKPILQWVNLVSDAPYTPLVSVSFHNDGPGSVHIAINNPDEFTELVIGEDLDIDMVGSNRRVEFIFYRTISGIGSVRVVGKY